eukprot:jgi/Mesvir1/23038/Mv26132-RA.2
MEEKHPDINMHVYDRHNAPRAARVPRRDLAHRQRACVIYSKLSVFVFICVLASLYLAVYQAGFNVWSNKPAVVDPVAERLSYPSSVSTPYNLPATASDAYAGSAKLTIIASESTISCNDCFDVRHGKPSRSIGSAARHAQSHEHDGAVPTSELLWSTSATSLKLMGPEAGGAGPSHEQLASGTPELDLQPEPNNVEVADLTTTSGRRRLLGKLVLEAAGEWGVPGMWNGIECRPAGARYGSDICLHAV